MKIDIRWDEIQEFYDKNTLDDTLSKFKISKSYFYKGASLGLINKRTMSESLKLALSKLPKKKHSEETKKKISEIRKKFILENPDKAPYKLNHSSKESYPERYFTDLFEKENIKIERYYQIGLYELDFCIPEKKIDIEIDGNQHYYDVKIIESDIRRTKFLEENGWDVIRIKWSEYNSLNYEEKCSFIFNLKNYINKLVNEKPTIAFIKKRKGYNLCECGREKARTSNKCINCCESKKRKVVRPEHSFLIAEVKSLGYKGTGIKYGVSDNCIRKWLKFYEKIIC